MDLANTSQNTGEAAGDVYLSIDHLAGSHNYGDTLYGDDGGNRLWGGGGSDHLKGRKGEDRLLGAQGNDTLEGGDGNDRLEGGSNNDLLKGGNHHDALYGENGNDTLDGGYHNDTLTGGAGSDVFVFSRNSDQDRVTDFENNTDTLDLSGLGLTSASHALGYATRTNGNVIFDFGDGDILTVLNMTKNALQDDIIF